ncbi:hypothetical protein CPC08DRAFT_610465, partial [Agrocybe pediades]
AACDEAQRFGILTVSPTTVRAGDTINLNTDLRCAAELGINPIFLDYSIENLVNNNGFELPLLLARRAIPAGAQSDSFTTTVPHGFFFAGANYSVVINTVYPLKGSDGSQIIQEGGTDTPINVVLN